MKRCSNLIEERQQETRRQCLEAWGVPDEARAPVDRREPPKDALKRLFAVRTRSTDKH